MRENIRVWITHEWLAEVFIYAIFAFGSFPALIVTFAAIITLAFALVYMQMPGRPYIAAFALFLAALATAPTWGVRPQMLSMLLTSVFLFVLRPHPMAQPLSGALRRTNDAPSPPLSRQGRELWLLVPLMILWVNLHSGYALGLALIAVYLFGEGVDVIASEAKQSPSYSDAYAASSHPSFRSGSLLAMTRSLTTRHSSLVTLASVFAVCFIAVLFNPNGATMYAYPFETLTSPTMQAYIQEWFSPDFHFVEFQPFAILLLATLAAMALSGKRASLTQTILLAGFGYAALRSARNIPIFALIAAPVLAEHLWHIVESRGWATILSRQNRISRGMIAINWLLLALIVAAAMLRLGMVAANQNQVERARFPAAAVDFLQKEKLPGALYNASGWGGYLIWRLYPETRVFIDGRADVYGDAFIENVFLKAYRGGADWRTPLEQYNVRVVLVEPDAPMAARLAQEGEWRKVYEDKQAVIYAR
jgi:hypothetical protein